MGPAGPALSAGAAATHANRRPQCWLSLMAQPPAPLLAQAGLPPLQLLLLLGQAPAAMVVAALRAAMPQLLLLKLQGGPDVGTEGMWAWLWPPAHMGPSCCPALLPGGQPHEA